MVPVPHFGACLTVDQFELLASKLTTAGVTFILEPKLRFKGQPGEQYTMFLEDPRYDQSFFDVFVPFF